MAEFTRQAKGSWREHELMAYNISIAEQDQQTFFDGPLPNYTGPPGFAQNEDVTKNLNFASVILIRHLKLATQIAEGEESSVADFASVLLRSMDYEQDDTIVRMCKRLRLDMCGEEVFLEADVCVMDCNTSNILLVVQEDKSHINLAADPQAQLVADAIAAFQMNNANRRDRLFLPTFDSQVIPGITMIGTCPRFYKIHVTSALDHCVRGGLYPAIKTTVYRHTPRIKDPSYDIMKPLANRTLTLGLYEAFKNFVYRK
jgi:hypothetical protein